MVLQKFLCAVVCKYEIACVMFLKQNKKIHLCLYPVGWKQSDGIPTGVRIILCSLETRPVLRESIGITRPVITNSGDLEA